MFVIKVHERKGGGKVAFMHENVENHEIHTSEIVSKFLKSARGTAFHLLDYKPGNNVIYKHVIIGGKEVN